MEFNYYYGNQAEQFTFIRIPKIMLTDKAFADLSIQAKMLYGVLLDRMGLSMKNKWLDEDNKVFIIYQISEIQEDLGFSKKKSMDFLSELEKFGLVEKKRRGLGLSNIIYVKSFLSGTSRSVDLGTSGNEEEQADEVSEGGETGASAAEDEKIVDKSVEKAGKTRRKGKISGSKTENECRSVDSGTSRSVEMGTSRSVDLGTSRGAEIALQEVPDRALLRSNNKLNNTEFSDIKSNQIISLKSACAPVIRCDDDEMNAYAEIIRENIDLDALLQRYPFDQEMVRGIYDMILETVLTQGDTVLISSNTYPTQLVKSKFLKLNYSHIEYVMGCMKKNTTKVQNIKKYLLAALFNAPSTIDGYFQAEVNHDFPQYAAR